MSAASVHFLFVFGASSLAVFTSVLVGLYCTGTMVLQPTKAPRVANGDHLLTESHWTKTTADVLALHDSLLQFATSFVLFLEVQICQLCVQDEPLLLM